MAHECYIAPSLTGGNNARAPSCMPTESNYSLISLCTWVISIILALHQILDDRASVIILPGWPLSCLLDLMDLWIHVCQVSHIVYSVSLLDLNYSYNSGLILSFFFTWSRYDSIQASKELKDIPHMILHFFSIFLCIFRTLFIIFILGQILVSSKFSFKQKWIMSLLNICFSASVFLNF